MYCIFCSRAYLVPESYVSLCALWRLFLQVLDPLLRELLFPPAERKEHHNQVGQRDARLSFLVTLVQLGELGGGRRQNLTSFYNLLLM
jgi:hypothetical protein